MVKLSFFSRLFGGLFRGRFLGRCRSSLLEGFYVLAGQVDELAHHIARLALELDFVKAAGDAEDLYLVALVDPAVVTAGGGSAGAEEDPVFVDGARIGFRSGSGPSDACQQQYEGQQQRSQSLG